MYSVLFLCTGNAARSILAEALLNRWGHGTFRAFSAGSHPAGYVHPLALELLQKRGLPTQGLSSKSWHEFISPEAPDFHFIFTLCDRAAAEVCTVWPGHPLAAHWGIEDPAAFCGGNAARRQIFLKVFQTLEARIKLFVNLPITNLQRSPLKQRLEEIGRMNLPRYLPAWAAVPLRAAFSLSRSRFDLVEAIAATARHGPDDQRAIMAR